MALPQDMALPQQLAEGDFRQAEKQKDQNTPREARDQSRAREKGREEPGRS
jgi:hypothetical protein